MLHVWSDIMTAADQRQVALLALLDMSSAFDSVDHDLLLQRLRVTFRINDTSLEWISSFLSDRTYQLAYDGELSTTHLLQYGVPQGSVLGPMLYILYTVHICHVVERHNLRLHLYAGQLQTIYSECPKFHPNPFTSGGVIAESANIVETRHKVFPILGKASFFAE